MEGDAKKTALEAPGVGLSHVEVVCVRHAVPLAGAASLLPRMCAGPAAAIVQCVEQCEWCGGNGITKRWSLEPFCVVPCYH